METGQRLSRSCRSLASVGLLLAVALAACAVAHLSNGTELGPTRPVDVAPRKTIDIRLPASGQSFEKWSAHAEVG